MIVTPLCAKVSVLIACLLMCTATVMSEEFVAEIDSTGEVEVEVAMEDTEAMLKYARKHMQEESEKKKVAEQKHQDEAEKQKKKDDCTCKKDFIDGSIFEYYGLNELTFIVIGVPYFFYAIIAGPIQMAVCFFQVPVFSCALAENGVYLMGVIVAYLAVCCFPICCVAVLFYQHFFSNQ
jgi:hypothetical protein